MQREPAAFLWDVREAIGHIREFIEGFDSESFQTDGLVQSAVERKFEIIGEALNQLSKIAPDVAARIPDTKRIIGFRNILIHGYAVLDQTIVWRVIEEHLPTLETAVQKLLDAEASPGS